MVLGKTVLKNKKIAARSGTKSEMSINCVILRTLVHPFTVKSHTAFWEGVERKPFGYASFEMREDDLKSVRSIGCNIKKHSNTKSWRYVFDLICESLENTDSLGGKLSSKCINLVLFLSFVSHLFSTVGVILCKFSTRHRQKHMIWYITRLWSTNILSQRFSIAGVADLTSANLFEVLWRHETHFRLVRLSSSFLEGIYAFVATLF